MGFVTWTLIVAGFYLGRKHPVVRCSAAVFVAIFLLTLLWPGGYTLWRIVYYAPGAAALRTVSRWGLFMVFPFAIALAYALDRMGRRVSVIAVAAAGLCVAA